MLFDVPDVFSLFVSRYVCSVVLLSHTAFHAALGKMTCVEELNISKEMAINILLPEHR